MAKGSIPPPQRYRDTPGLDDALSLHTTQGDYDTDSEAPIDTPPAYTDEDGVSTAPLDSTSSDLKLIKERNGVNIYMDKRADSDPVFLEKTIRNFAKQPPRPRIQIQGTHTQTVKNGDKKEKKTIVDFDISLDLTRYILSHVNQDQQNPYMELRTVENSQKTYRGTILKARGPGAKADLEVGSHSPSLEEWCHLYCASPSSLKTFRLTRKVVGMNEKIFKDSIEHLIRSTNYKGHVNITFPVSSRAVDFYSTHRLNTWRLTTWIYMLFIFSMLWIFTWPYLFFTTKRWSIAEVTWPFSLQASEDSNRRCYVTESEEDIFRNWRAALERAVLEKRQGPLLPEDLEPRAEREFRSGNDRVDRAVGLLGSGIQAFNEVNRQLGWGGDC